MYSNLANADKKVLNNEDYVKKIMESEVHDGKVKLSKGIHQISFNIQLIQDSNNNVNEHEETKNYYWKTEERDGIRYNTLNYTNKKKIIRNESEDSNTNSSERDSSKTCCSFMCCLTLVLLFIIFILIISLIFFIIKCFSLEETIRELRLFIKNSSKVSENQNFMVSQSSTVKSATFFPEQKINVKMKNVIMKKNVYTSHIKSKCI